MRQERSEAILSDVKGRDILNAGCFGHVLPTTEDERGHWLHMRLMRQFADAEILGLDIDQANINCVRALGMNTELGDAQHLSYHANFDAIILGETIDHLENPGGCLEGCRRALKPGGRIIISTPNISALCKYSCTSRISTTPSMRST